MLAPLTHSSTTSSGSKNLPLHLLPNLHRLINNLIALIPPQIKLLGPQLLRLLNTALNGHKVIIRRQMPKEGARDAHQWPLRDFLLPLGNHLKGLLVDDYLVEAGLDEAAGEMLELLSRLHEEMVTRGDLDRDAVAGVAGPDVQAGVARAAVDGEEVEVGVEAGEDGVFCAVLSEI